MKNSESVHITQEVGRGRERVPTAAALDAQKKLVFYMTPERILNYINPKDEYDPFLEALMLRYMDMYDSGDYNGFAEYCDNCQMDSLFMNRLINQELTTEDLERMKDFLVSHSGDKPFFVDEVEINNFISVNTH